MCLLYSCTHTPRHTDALTPFFLLSRLLRSLLISPSFLLFHVTAFIFTTPFSCPWVASVLDHKGSVSPRSMTAEDISFEVSDWIRAKLCRRGFNGLDREQRHALPSASISSIVILGRESGLINRTLSSTWRDAIWCCHGFIVGLSQNGLINSRTLFCHVMRCCRESGLTHKSLLRLQTTCGCSKESTAKCFWHQQRVGIKGRYRKEEDKSSV